MSAQEYGSDGNSSDDEIACFNVDEDCEPDPEIRHPEFFEYECLTVQETEAFLNESAEIVSKKFQITPSLAKVVLHANRWHMEAVFYKYLPDSTRLFPDSDMKQGQPHQASESSKDCPVCLTSYNNTFRSLECRHFFCQRCWVYYLELHVNEGWITNITCMSNECRALATEDFVLAFLSQQSMRDRYLQLVFREYVKSHPQLISCPNTSCETVIRARKPSAKQVVCNVCTATFCFICGREYHAPANCSTVTQWLMITLEDAETANYFTTNTKFCPKCYVPIEKSGGCNHIVCTNCHYEFCWMCLGNWNTHTLDMYSCSFYTNHFVQAQATRVLHRYIHYYARWQNHSNSLKLEEQKLQMITLQTDNVVDDSRTWIDRDSLLEAAKLLVKSRRTLQYTYPHAYYMDPGPQKQLFEYQQAQLEAQVEGLAWKLERTATIGRGDLLNQMDIVEKLRTALLKDSLNVH